MLLTRTLVRFCGALAATFALGLVLSAAETALAVSPNVVISQVYGGAGCATTGCSTYNRDYIELFNRGTSAVALNGWSVQYASSTSISATIGNVTVLSNFTLQPGQYYLVGESGPFATGVNPIPTPDVSASINMSQSAAKVFLVNNTTPLTLDAVGCPTSFANVVDFIGYGTANCAETAPAPAPSTTTADIRKLAGRLDTDNNSTDFVAAAPTPRNSASPTVQVTQTLIISEFRLRGPMGANDEFVEIYNTSSSDDTVFTLDGSAGFALVASDGTTRFTVPNSTVIPARRALPRRQLRRLLARQLRRHGRGGRQHHLHRRHPRQLRHRALQHRQPGQLHLGEPARCGRLERRGQHALQRGRGLPGAHPVLD